MIHRKAQRSQPCGHESVNEISQVTQHICHANSAMRIRQHLMGFFMCGIYNCIFRGFVTRCIRGKITISAN